MAVSKLALSFGKFDFQFRTDELRKIKTRQTSVNVNADFVCIAAAHTYVKYYGEAEYGDEFVRHSYITSTNRRADLLYGPLVPLVGPETRTVHLHATKRTFTCSCGGPARHSSNAPWKAACFKDGSYRVLDVPTLVTAVYDKLNCALVDDKGNVLYLKQQQLFPRLGVLRRGNMETLRKLQQWREERERRDGDGSIKWRRADSDEEDYWEHPLGDTSDAGEASGAPTTLTTADYEDELDSPMPSTPAAEEAPAPATA